MDWTVELHRDDGGDVKMIDLPNFEAVLACIKEHKRKDSLAPLASMPKCSLPMRNALR